MIKKSRAVSSILLTAVMASALTGCLGMGNMSAVKDGLQYAVDCKPDEALKVLDQAVADGGVSEYLGRLERIVVLQDAGRSEAAKAALDKYMALPEVEGDTRTEVEDSIRETLESLRKEREKQTGSRTCA